MQVHHRILLGLTVLTASASAAAGVSLSSKDHHCDISSAYSLNLNGDGIAFDSDKASPRQVRLDNGRLYIDGREIAVSNADRRTLHEIEGEVREISGEVVVIASDGIDLAFDALSEVSAAFIEDQSRHADIVRSMEKTRAIIQTQIRDAALHRPFDKAAFETLIESHVEKLAAELVQVVAAEFVPRAISAALTGNEAAVADIEARAERLEADIERRIERKAAEIEKRAEGLCPRVNALIGMQSSLDLRLENGGKLLLIEN